MAWLPTLDHLLVQLFALLLVWAAVSDVRSFLIPNRISLAIAALYPAHLLVSPLAADWPAALLLALIVFAVGAFAFARGWFGGGDVKLLTAVTLWAGPALAAPMILVTALAGAALSLALLARPALAWIGIAAPGPAPGLRGKVPYGVAIVAGGLYVAAKLLTR